MSNQNRPLEQMAMTNLIGKVVTIDRERFPHTEGENDSLSFNLPKDASSVSVNILNEMGENIMHKDLGTQKKGEVSFVWDGTKSNTLPAKAGNYIYRVTAVDGRGQTINISPQAQGKVIGVSFENTEPVFLVGDARRQDKITLRNIVRIEVDHQISTVSPASGLDPSQKVAVVDKDPTKSPNFIPFQKGVGSPEFGAGKPHVEMPTTLTPLEVPAAEKGFPNGLQDPDQPRGGDNL